MKKFSSKTYLFLFLFAGLTTQAFSQIINQTFSANPTSICGPDSSLVTTGGSEVGVNYYLRNDANDMVVAGPVAGTGQPISFSTGLINATTTYNIYADTTAGLPDIGSSLDLSGAVGYVSVASNPVFDLLTEWTIETWVKLPNVAGTKNLIERYNFSGGTGGFALRTSGAMVQAYVIANATSNSAVTGAVLSANTWTHIAASFNNATNTIKIYINGALVVTNTGITLSPLTSTTTLKFGALGDNGQVSQVGLMDNMRIWNVTRSDAEILANYYSCMDGNEPGLVVSYNCNDGTGSTTVADSGPGSRNGTFVAGLPAASWAAGGFDCATNGVYLEMAGLTTVTYNSLPNVTANANSLVLCQGDSLTLNGTGATTYAWTPAITDGSPFVPATSGTYICEGTGGPPFCINRDTVSIAVLTQADQAVSITDPIVCENNATTVNLAGSEAGYYYFLRDNANNDIIAGGFPGTGSAMSLNTGPIAAPITYNVFASENGSFTSDSLSLELGTNSQFVQVTSTAALGLTNDFTLECWVKMPSNGIHNLIEKYSGNSGYAFRMENGTIKAFVLGGAVSQTNAGFTGNNTWTHLAMTFDNAKNQVSIYQNGYLSGIGNNVTVTALANGQTLKFGARGDDANTAGSETEFMDEVRIWNVARSGNEIRSFMNTCLSGNEEGLVAYYTFEDALVAGTTADNTGNGNTGTIQNNPAVVRAGGAFSCGEGDCPMVMTQTVSVTTTVLDSSVTVLGNTITANAAGMTYQWVDCDNGYSFIVGENGQSFSPTITGNYACIIDNGVCSDTSACNLILIVGMEDQLESSLQIFPNPAHNQLNIRTANQITGVSFFDMLGKRIFKGTSKVIDIETLETGVYVIEIQTTAGTVFRKFIKQ